MKKRIIICMIIATALEICVFNLGTILAIGNQKEVVTNSYSVEGATLNHEDGTYTIDSEQVILYAGGIEKKVSDLYLGIDFEDEIIPYNMRMTDEGNTAMAYETATQYVLKWSDYSRYIRIHTYGKLLTNKIIFNVTPGKKMRICEISYNPVRHMRIRPLRLFFIAFLLFGFSLFAGASSIHDILAVDAEENSRIKRVKLLLSIGYVAVGVAMVSWFVFRCGGHWSTFAYMSEYADLAKSMTEGHYYLDYEVSDALLQAENPYDYTYRAANMVEASWDTAYYNGKYYCYFGVTPVLLLYLPYRLICGMDLNNVVAAFVFSVITWLGATWFCWECIRRYFKNSPFWYWLIASMLLGGNVQLIYLYQRPDMYDIPILAGNALAFIGLASWIHGLNNSNKKRWFVLGSLSIALISGCRPHMVILAFLAIPIFYELLIRSGEQRLQNWEKYGLYILTPFFVVACYIMHYNYARFGSILEFGAKYNLTTSDMTRTGFYIDRLGSGLFSYLIQLPSLLSVFPYMIRSNVATEYMGKMFTENIYGGVLTTNLLFVALLFKRYIKTKEREKEIKIYISFCLILGLVLCCTDIMMGGVSQRYMGDFSVVLTMAAVLSMGVLLSRCREEEKEIYYSLSMLCWVAVLYVTFIGFGLTCIQLREYDADNTTRILYHELRSYFVLQ